VRIKRHCWTGILNCLFILSLRSKPVFYSRFSFLNFSLGDEHWPVIGLFHGYICTTMQHPTTAGTWKGKRTICAYNTLFAIQLSWESQHDFGKQFCIVFIEVVNKDNTYTSIKDNKLIKPSFLISL